MQYQGYIVEVSPQEFSSIRDLVVSFLRAVERFRTEERQASNLDEQLTVQSRGRSALLEALNWADAIDQYLRQGPPGRPREQDWTGALTPAKRDVVQAFQRVRNLAHHRWWEAVTVQISTAQDEQVNRWIWGPLPDRKRQGATKDADRDAAFARALQGKSVMTTLDELAATFWEKRGWEIRREDLEQPGHRVGTPLALDG